MVKFLFSYFLGTSRAIKDIKKKSSNTLVLKVFEQNEDKILFEIRWHEWNFRILAKFYDYTLR